MPLLVAVKFRGTVDNVTSAVEAALDAVKRISGVVSYYTIQQAESDTEKMLKLDGFDRD